MTARPGVQNDSEVMNPAGSLDFPVYLAPTSELIFKVVCWCLICRPGRQDNQVLVFITVEFWFPGVFDTRRYFFLNRINWEVDAYLMVPEDPVWDIKKLSCYCPFLYTPSVCREPWLVWGHFTMTSLKHKMLDFCLSWSFILALDQKKIVCAKVLNLYK
jgi:hypothetical protein